MSKTLLYGLILYDIIEGKRFIGGPAINIALHMAFHNEQPTLVSCIGNDSLGSTAKKMLVDNHISTDFIMIDNIHATGTVPVFLDKKGIPTFEILQSVAYDFITLTDEQLEKLSRTSFDILYFGTVVQRTVTSADTLRKILDSVSYKSIFFDINLREGHFTKKVIEFSLNQTDIFKLNDQEILWVAAIFGLETREEQKIVDWVFKQFPVNIILLTRGENGASVFITGARKDLAGIK